MRLRCHDPPPPFHPLHCLQPGRPESWLPNLHPPQESLAEVAISWWKKSSGRFDITLQIQNRTITAWPHHVCGTGTAIELHLVNSIVSTPNAFRGDAPNSEMQKEGNMVPRFRLAWPGFYHWPDRFWRCGRLSNWVKLGGQRSSVANLNIYECETNCRIFYSLGTICKTALKTNSMESGQQRDVLHCALSNLQNG